jgi:hypothetical protein
MAMQLGHVHIKTREDPQKVAKFYIDNFGATVKREIPGRGCQLDLHGVQLNVTTIIADQNHEQSRPTIMLAPLRTLGITARRSSKRGSTTVGMCAGLPHPTARRWN